MSGTWKDSKISVITCKDSKIRAITSKDSKISVITCKDSKIRAITSKDSKISAITCKDSKISGITCKDSKICGITCKGAHTEKAGLPAQATGTNLLPELRYINKYSAHWQNRLVQVLTGNPLSLVIRNELFIPVSRTCSTRSKIIYFWYSCASK